ncbi:NAD(P)/FAD-dependent oxidoreductase [Sagittula sp. M10.9X]|uniref:NAD(P)/FAD-dependent oxidoreductase n=1 Tax=Sagittula salina TaxID=2820268 RepID=A0A940MT23_9RHOB|nr:NAD(P)/FAD-dependent oxidoreductase [Sagittula salina]
MAERLIIVGAGMAAGRVLEHLTEEAPDRFEITLFNAEPRGTYNRIMLSPVLSGEKTYEQIVTHDADWYARRGVTCRFGERVLSIDTQARVVEAEHGQVSYDRLILATGSAPFIVPVPGHRLPGVLAYRDLDDTDRMISAARPGARAVVIGGGLLGLEAAAGLRARGMAVTVLHLMDHLMERQLDPEAGALLKEDQERKGIDVILDAATEEIAGKTRAEAVVLKDGREIPCDIVVMAVGIRPSFQLAQTAGIACGRAITVDAQMRTQVPGVYALGECVEFNGALFGLVAPLYDQARVLAHELTGVADAFVPRELATKLKVTGCDLFSAGDFTGGDGREEIVFRDPSARIYKRLVLERGRLIGAIIYGDVTGANWLHQLIQEGRDVSTMRETLIFGPDAQGTDGLSRSSLAA